MQELIIASVTEKKPRGGGNAFYVIKGQGGEDLTTHDSAALGWGPGTRLNAELKVAGSHVNLGEYQVISLVPAGSNAAPAPVPDALPAALPPAPGSQGDRYKRDQEGIQFEYDLKAEQARELTVSFEARIAFQGVVDLVKSDHLPIADDLAKDALAWAKGRFKASVGILAGGVSRETAEAIAMTSGPTREAASRRAADVDESSNKPPGPEEPPAPFPHVGALLKWSLDNGVDRRAFLKLIGCSEEQLPKINITEAALKVKDFIAERAKQNAAGTPF